MKKIGIIALILAPMVGILIWQSPAITDAISAGLMKNLAELFSGIFYSSMFETFVNDATNTAYFIDMVIEHQEYGTISSSVYNPRDSTNTIINGVFSQS